MNRLTGPEANVVAPGGGRVGATVGAAASVGSAGGLGVSNTQAANGIAAANIARRNFSFIPERIT
jgi:hypothetical protein